MKLLKDRRRWVQWLYQAKKRYGLIILNYTVTSNHIQLLVPDGEGRNVIPESIKLIAGRTAQEYNLRKMRKGAFGKDRYHAAAVESEKHLLRCLRGCPSLHRFEYGAVQVRLPIFRSGLFVAMMKSRILEENPH